MQRNHRGADSDSESESASSSDSDELSDSDDNLDSDEDLPPQNRRGKKRGAAAFSVSDKLQLRKKSQKLVHSLGPVDSIPDVLTKKGSHLKFVTRNWWFANGVLPLEDPPSWMPDHIFDQIKPSLPVPDTDVNKFPNGQAYAKFKRNGAAMWRASDRVENKGRYDGAEQERMAEECMKVAMIERARARKLAERDEKRIKRRQAKRERHEQDREDAAMENRRAKAYSGSLAVEFDSSSSSFVAAPCPPPHPPPYDENSDEMQVG
jgi:hypothetical protein